MLIQLTVDKVGVRPTIEWYSCYYLILENCKLLQDGDGLKIKTPSIEDRNKIEVVVKSVEAALIREFGRFQLVCKRSKQNQTILYIFYLE